MLQVLQYKIEQNQTISNLELEKEIQFIDKNITSLLSNVNPELVKKYFPDFYKQ